MRVEGRTTVAIKAVIITGTMATKAETLVVETLVMAEEDIASPRP